MADKRRCHRLQISLPTSFKSDENQNNISMASTMDISAFGLCLTSKAKLKVGQRIPLQVMLPTNEKVVIRSEVIWVKEEQVYDVKEYRVGVKILEPITANEAEFVKFYAEELIAYYKKKSK